MSLDRYIIDQTGAGLLNGEFDDVGCLVCVYQIVAIGQARSDGGDSMSRV